MQNDNRFDMHSFFVLIAWAWIGFTVMFTMACGDNQAAPPPAPIAVGHSPESQIVTKGTYHPVIADGAIAWELSGDGEVYVPLRGVPQGTTLGRIELVGLSTSAPGIAFVDQVQNAQVELPITCTGDLVSLALVACTIDPPGLMLGSASEFTWIKVTAAGTPVTLWSLYWEAP